MMNPTQPFVLHAAPCQEGWGDVARGNVLWRTLFSSDITPTNALTAGVYEITSGNALEVHRHSAPEVYFILAGTGLMTVGDAEHVVQADSAIYVPCHVLHGIRNIGPDLLRLFYVFAVDGFGEVKYIF
ncbi:MAG: cupin domain-containing protein [Chloroflexota bacterium]|jgi:mannose-6-phosphate isomerase-like protein (cupin superfamily)